MDRADPVGKRRQREVRTVDAGRHDARHGLARGAAHRERRQPPGIEQLHQRLEHHAGLDVDQVSGVGSAGIRRGQRGRHHVGEHLIEPVGLDDVAGRGGDVGHRPAAADRAQLDVIAGRGAHQLDQLGATARRAVTGWMRRHAIAGPVAPRQRRRAVNATRPVQQRIGGTGVHPEHLDPGRRRGRGESAGSEVPLVEPSVIGALHQSPMHERPAREGAAGADREQLERAIASECDRWQATRERRRRGALARGGAAAVERPLHDRPGARDREQLDGLCWRDDGGQARAHPGVERGAGEHRPLPVVTVEVPAHRLGHRRLDREQVERAGSSRDRGQRAGREPEAVGHDARRHPAVPAVVDDAARACRERVESMTVQGHQGRPAVGDPHRKGRDELRDRPGLPAVDRAPPREGPGVGDRAHVDAAVRQHRRGRHWRRELTAARHRDRADPRSTIDAGPLHDRAGRVDREGADARSRCHRGRPPGTNASPEDVQAHGELPSTGAPRRAPPARRLYTRASRTRGSFAMRRCTRSLSPRRASRSPPRTPRSRRPRRPRSASAAAARAAAPAGLDA